MAVKQKTVLNEGEYILAVFFGDGRPQRFGPMTENFGDAIKRVVNQLIMDSPGVFDGKNQIRFVRKTVRTCNHDQKKEKNSRQAKA